MFGRPFRIRIHRQMLSLHNDYFSKYETHETNEAAIFKTSLECDSMEPNEQVEHNITSCSHRPIVSADRSTAPMTCRGCKAVQETIRNDNAKKLAGHLDQALHKINGWSSTPKVVWKLYSSVSSTELPSVSIQKVQFSTSK